MVIYDRMTLVIGINPFYTGKRGVSFFLIGLFIINSWNLLTNRPLSHGGHFESQGNKKLCFCPSSLALDERLDVQNLLFQHCVIKVYCNNAV